MHSEFRERENPDDTVWFYLEQENFPYSMALVGECASDKLDHGSGGYPAVGGLKLCHL